MTTFTKNNTEGYSVDQLDALNRIFEYRMAEVRHRGIDVDHDDNKSLRDYIAERLLIDYDATSP